MRIFFQLIFRLFFIILGIKANNISSYLSSTINSSLDYKTIENLSNIENHSNKSFWFNFFSRKTRLITTATQQITTLKELYNELSHLQPCNRTLQSPLISQLLSEAVINLEKNLTAYLWLFDLSSKITYLPYAKGIIFLKFIIFIRNAQ